MGEEGESCAEGIPRVAAVPAGGLRVLGTEKTMPEWEEAEEGAGGSSRPGFFSWPRAGGGGGGLQLGSPSQVGLTSSCQKTQQE